MLKVKFIKYKNVLIADILEQGEEIIKGNFEFEHDGYNLISAECVMIGSCDDTLYIEGRATQKHCTNGYRFNTEEELDKYVAGISNCIRAYNNTLTSDTIQSETKEWVVE